MQALQSTQGSGEGGMDDKSFAGQLLAALARNTPAFRPAVRGDGLTAAVLRRTPAFGARGHPDVVFSTRSGTQDARSADISDERYAKPTTSLTHPNVILLLRLDRVGPRAAAQDRERTTLEEVSSSQEWRGVLRETGPDVVEMTLEAGRPLPARHVVPITVETAGRRLSYFIVLTAEAAALNVGDLVISGVDASLKVVVHDPRPATSLSADDVAAIRRSVRATARAGRNAWRAIARGRAPDDPVRQAIASQL